MNYINTETLEYPITELRIREVIEDPKSEKLIPPEYQVVFPSKQPKYNPVTSKITEVLPIYEFGGYYQRWEVSSKFIPSEEFGSIEQQELLAMQKAESFKEAKTLKEARDAAKVQRQIEVDSIVVTTTAGNTFDGDENSQTRMTRAILALQVTGGQSITWVLADNSVIQASVPELIEALSLAGAAQSAIWHIP